MKLIETVASFSGDTRKIIWNDPTRKRVEKFAQNEKIKELMDKIDAQINEK